MTAERSSTRCAAPILVGNCRSQRHLRFSRPAEPRRRGRQQRRPYVSDRFALGQAPTAPLRSRPRGRGHFDFDTEAQILSTSVVGRRNLSRVTLGAVRPSLTRTRPMSIDYSVFMRRRRSKAAWIYQSMTAPEQVPYWCRIPFPSGPRWFCVHRVACGRLPRQRCAHVRHRCGRKVGSIGISASGRFLCASTGESMRVRPRRGPRKCRSSTGTPITKKVRNAEIKLVTYRKPADSVVLACSAFRARPARCRPTRPARKSATTCV